MICSCSHTEWNFLFAFIFYAGGETMASPRTRRVLKELKDEQTENNRCFECNTNAPQVRRKSYKIYLWEISQYAIQTECVWTSLFSWIISSWLTLADEFWIDNDCVQWVSVSYGIFICLECSGELENVQFDAVFEDESFFLTNSILHY